MHSVGLVCCSSWGCKESDTTAQLNNNTMHYVGFSSGSVVKNLPAMLEMQETWVRSLGWEDPLEEA